LHNRILAGLGSDGSTSNVDLFGTEHNVVINFQEKPVSVVLRRPICVPNINALIEQLLAAIIGRAILDLQESLVSRNGKA
jgi:hypothetical protein